MNKLLRRKLLYVNLLLLLAGNQVYSQQKKDVREAKQLAKKGDKYFKRDDFHNASTFYSKALALDSAHVGALYHTGLCLFHLYGDFRTVHYMNKAYRIDTSYSKHYDYWLGRTYHVNLDFDKAEHHYRKYLSTLKKNDTRIPTIEKLLVQTEIGRTYVAKVSDYYARSLGDTLNSPYSDHSPILTSDKNTLFFTSRRTKDKSGKEITPKGDSFESIYMASNANGVWMEAKPASERINQKRQHTSNVQLFDNDQKMLVYKSSKFGSIFMSEMKEGEWTKPLIYNKYAYTPRFEASGFVVRDEKVMYFSSSRGAKNGNLDLFVSHHLENGNWSEPEPLPDFINTDSDEDAPFLSEDGLTLYFSSRGHDSMGGFDVFKATYSPASQTWSKPVNLGHPINSPSDDIFFTTDGKDKQISYLTSNRPGTRGEEDIFVVKQYEQVLVRGTVSSQSNGAPLPGLAVNFTDKDSFGQKAGTVTGSSGQYGMQLRSNHRYSVEVRNPEGEVLATGEVAVPPAYEESEQAQVVKNFQINIPGTPVLAEAKRMKVENLNLVKMQYHPLDSLTIAGTVSDEQNRLADARVVVRKEDSDKILYTTTTDANGNYIVHFVPGKETDFVVEVTKPGYLLNSIVILYNNQVGHKGNELELKSTMVNSVDANTQMLEIRVGARQVLGGVYFEFNSAVLLPESSIALNRLFDFLQENPTITMEIGGHTDNIGSAYVNRVVSQKRAQAVVNYLIKKGTSSKRLVAKGYGAEQPIASNEASLNGRDVNRRVEITILSK